jgi:hypothetical protein
VKPLIWSLPRLYGPLVGFIVAVGMAIHVSGTTGTVVYFSLFNILQTPIAVQSEAVARGAWCLGGLVSLSALICLDYVGFFPTLLRMSVFYDADGIRESVSSIPRRIRRKWNIAADFTVGQKEFFAILDREAKEVSGIDEYFTATGSEIHSVGQTSFVVRKASGVQKYHVEEARGELRHERERAHELPRSLMAHFEKAESRFDFLHPTPWDLVACGVVIRPRFKQMLAVDRQSVGTVFRTVVVGVTRVRLYPLPDVSNTIYCWEREDGSLTPVAYAIYEV